MVAFVEGEPGDAEQELKTASKVKSAGEFEDVETLSLSELRAEDRARVYGPGRHTSRARSPSRASST